MRKTLAILTVLFFLMTVTTVSLAQVTKTAENVIHITVPSVFILTVTPQLIQPDSVELGEPTVLSVNGDPIEVELRIVTNQPEWVVSVQVTDDPLGFLDTGKLELSMGDGWIEVDKSSATFVGPNTGRGVHKFNVQYRVTTEYKTPDGAYPIVVLYTGTAL